MQEQEERRGQLRLKQRTQVIYYCIMHGVDPDCSVPDPRDFARIRILGSVPESYGPGLDLDPNPDPTFIS
jgi:hypothetical protein